MLRVGWSSGRRCNRRSAIGRYAAVTRHWDTRWRLHKADRSQYNHSHQEESGMSYLEHILPLLSKCFNLLLSVFCVYFIVHTSVLDKVKNLPCLLKIVWWRHLSCFCLKLDLTYCSTSNQELVANVVQKFSILMKVATCYQGNSVGCQACFMHVFVTGYQRVSIASYASAGIARGGISVCPSVRHSPVLYQKEES